MPRPTLFLLLLTFAFAFVSAAAQADEKLVLVYRLVTKKTVHIDDAKKAKDYESALKSLKVDVTVNAHGDHTDVSFVCPNWLEREYADHDACLKWQNWLRQLGFEAKHEHR